MPYDYTKVVERAKLLRGSNRTLAVASCGKRWNGLLPCPDDLPAAGEVVEGLLIGRGGPVAQAQCGQCGDDSIGDDCDNGGGGGVLQGCDGAYVSVSETVEGSDYYISEKVEQTKSGTCVQDGITQPHIEPRELRFSHTSQFDIYSIKRASITARPDDYHTGRTVVSNSGKSVTVSIFTRKAVNVSIGDTVSYTVSHLYYTPIALSKYIPMPVKVASENRHGYFYSNFVPRGGLSGDRWVTVFSMGGVYDNFKLTALSGGIKKIDTGAYHCVGYPVVAYQACKEAGKNGMKVRIEYIDIPQYQYHWVNDTQAYNYMAINFTGTRRA